MKKIVHRKWYDENKETSLDLYTVRNEKSGIPKANIDLVLHVTDSLPGQFEISIDPFGQVVHLMETRYSIHKRQSVTSLWILQMRLRIKGSRLPEGGLLGLQHASCQIVMKFLHMEIVEPLEWE